MLTKEKIMELAAKSFSSTLETWPTPSGEDEIIEFVKAIQAESALRQSQAIVSINEGEWPVCELMKLIDAAITKE